MSSCHGSSERQFNVFVFYDQAHTSVQIAKNLLKSSKSFPLLNRVIEKCSQVLRVESLSNPEHAFISIEHILHLADSNAKHDAVLWTVVSCFAQLGSLALLWEQHPDLFRSSSSSIGLCTGVIAAAASLFISSDADVVALTGELLGVSYRLGLETKRRSQAISPRNGSWSIAVQGLSEATARNALGEFHSQNNIRSHLKAWISAILPRSITISAPPETLDSLFRDNGVFAGAKTRKLPIYAAFHSEDMVCVDMDRVIGSAYLDRFQKRSGSSITFPRDARQFSSSLSKLLQYLLKDCLTNTLNMRDCGNFLPEADAINTHVVSIGPSTPVRHVEEWIGKSSRVQNTIFNPQPSGIGSNKTAIVGYGGRFPGADTLEEFWNILETAQDVHQPVPKDRFDVSTQSNDSSKRKHMASQPYGCFMKRPGAFDCSFFNMSPREAVQVDPIQRVLLMATQEALEMAGYSKQAVLTSRIGTFFGQATDDWRESHASQDIDIYYVGGGMRAFGPGRLNYFYKWLGPSFSVDAACSSSLAALELASRSLHSGDCDIAVVGGGNLISALPMFSGLHKAGFTSLTGSCKTFDATADGYCRGEGVGVVIVKRLEDAIQANDNVKGVMESIKTNHSAHAISITHPHAPTQAALMRDTLNDAGLEPNDIDYVEFHGTGTQAGDAAELSSVAQVFASRERGCPLYAGAVKANIGHGEAAAGVTSLIKALLMFENNTIPPHAGIKSKPNPALGGGQSSKLIVPNETLDFQVIDQPKRILINNFNAAGGNTSMILRSPPHVEKEYPKSIHIQYPVVVSAKSSLSLEQNLRNLKNFVDLNLDCNLADLSYTTTARRQHFHYREAILADSTLNLSASIDRLLLEGSGNRSDDNPAVAFVFSGQGNQSATIAKELFNECTEFRRSLEEYNMLCISLGLPSFLEFLLHSEINESWSPAHLQLGVVAVEMALAELWKSWGLRPGFVIGHSIGEYPALVIAGVLSLADMFQLIGQRAQLMEKRCKPGSHAMLAVSCPATEIKPFLEEPDMKDIEIACYNCDEAVTLSGTIASLENLICRLDEASIRFKRLDVQYAFHSAMLDPIFESYKSLSQSLPFRAPEIPLASTYHASVVQTAGVIGPDYLAKQCRHPVNFAGALRASEELENITENTLWIEIGPGNPVCLPLIQRLRENQDSKRLIASINNHLKPWEALTNGLAACYKNGVDVHWPNFFGSEKYALHLLDLPSYAFDLKDYWIPLEKKTKLTETSKSVRISPLLHYLEQNTEKEQNGSMSFRSELCDPDLFQAIQGHEVLGTPLCPSSVYAALALEAVSYLQSQSQKPAKGDQEYDVYCMDIQRPLIVQPASKSTLRIVVSWLNENQTYEVKFTTEGSKGTVVHAVTKVKKSLKTDWHAQWSQIDFLARARLETLETQSSQSTFVLQKQVLYKLFADIVKYDSLYQGIQSMILNKANNEAAAEIEFHSPLKAESKTDWHFIDALIHAAGFVLNNGIDESKSAFISDGWSSLQVFHDIERTLPHKCYTRLEPSADGQKFSGNVYVFSGEKIVASCTGIRFQRMNLESLRRFLSQQMNSRSEESINKKFHSQSNDMIKPKNPDEIEEPAATIEVTELVRKILAEESGVSFNQIEDKSTLQDLGLDSILIAEIAQRITTEAEIEISSESIMLAESVGRLKEFISGKQEITSVPIIPRSKEEHMTGKVKTGVESPEIETADRKSTPLPGSGSEQDIGELFQNVIVQETGATIKQVQEAKELSEVGVDSLLAVEILDLVEQKTGKTWPHSFLKDHPNIESIRAALIQRGRNEPHTSNSPAHQEDTNPKAPNGYPGPHKDISNGLINGQTGLKSKSVLLQGNSKSDKSPLFLLPPGLGAVAVYTNLPKNPHGVPIYGLSSPFLDDPTSPSFTIDNAVTAYIHTINNIRPLGSIHLGGWSLGGLLAYEIAKRLTEYGRQIGALMIIDCPFPDPWPANSPTLTVDGLTVMGHDKIMMERYGNNPMKLKHHVVGMMNAFKSFSSEPPSDLACIAHKCAIVAARGNQVKYMERALAAQKIINELGEVSDEAFKKIEDEYPHLKDYEDEKKEAPWEADRWDTLLGDGLAIHVVDSDHISLVTEPAPVLQLSKYMYNAIEIATRKLNPEA